MEDATRVPPSVGPGDTSDRRAGRRRWIAGGVASALAGPLVWLAATRSFGTAAVGVGTPGGAAGSAKGTAPLVDHEAPNFTLPDPSGARVELRQLRGKSVILNFWATWCAPCKEEMPEFEQLYRQYRDQGLAAIPVT